MVNCFRGVPYKLCYTHYFKVTNVMHSDTKLGLRKITQSLSEFQNVKGFASRNVNLASECKLPCVTSACGKKDYSLPLDSKSLLSRHLVVRPRQGNVIDILLQSRINARQSTHVLSSGFDNNLEKSELKCTDGRSLEKQPSAQGRPSEEQLEYTFQSLSQHLPRIMFVPLPVDDYHPKIILENNFKNKRTVGLVKYISQLAVFKIVAYFKFAHVRLQILKITKHPEDGTIKVRWRIVGIPGMAVIFQFWKYNPMNLDKKCEEAPTWIDGFSIYYVGNDGKIFKHILDRIQPDDDRISAKSKPTIVPKVTLFVGLLEDPEEVRTFASRDYKEYQSSLLQ